MRKFIISLFEDKNIPNWKEIAESLVDEGKCIVAGREPLYRGGIGNFLNTTEVPVNGMEYKLNKQELIESLWFKDKVSARKEELTKQLEELQRELEGISTVAIINEEERASLTILEMVRKYSLETPTEASEFNRDLDFDSLDMIELIMDVEEKFKITLPNDNYYRTVKDLIKATNERI